MRFRSSVAFGMIAATVYLASASRAVADGVMIKYVHVGDSGQFTPEPRQEAMLFRDGRNVRVVLRTHFQADAPEVAWFIPVPAEPHDIAPVEDDLFAGLDEMTAPRFSEMEPGGSFGCGCAAGSNSRPVVPTSVQVEQTGLAGIAEYKVLSANRPDELVDWLTAHGYAVPAGAAAAFSPYVQAGWHWLVVRLHPGSGATGELAPQPIAYSYESDSLVYPMMISRLSAEPETEVLLYVFARTRYACDNWTNALIDSADIHADPHSPSGTNYESFFRDLAKGAPHLFVTEYSREFSSDDYRMYLNDTFATPATRPRETLPRKLDWRLTRIRALLAPESMDRDVILVPLPGFRWVDNEFELSAATPAFPATASAALLGLIVSGARLRKNPRGILRIAANCCLLAAGLITVML